MVREEGEMPKTLHLTKKKQDAERIDHDNLVLLQKITAM